MKTFFLMRKIKSADAQANLPPPARIGLRHRSYIKNVS